MILIALCGRRKSGKSLAAKFITEYTGVEFREYAFATALKNAYAEMVGIDPTFLYHPLYEEIHRPGIQALSEEWKFKYGNDIFAKIVGESIKSQPYVVVSDLRFFEELKVLNDLGARVYRVHSDNLYRRKRGWEPSEADEHLSETELGDVSNDFLRQYRGGIILNNFNTEEELRPSIDKMVLTICAGL